MDPCLGTGVSPSREGWHTTAAQACVGGSLLMFPSIPSSLSTGFGIRLMGHVQKPPPELGQL